jgi:hypothetical protein
LAEQVKIPERDDLVALLAELSAENRVSYSIDEDIVSFSLPSLAGDIRVEAERFRSLPK